MKFNPVAWLLASPINPYWLNATKMDRGNRVILSEIEGRVLEVGAGDGAKKAALMERYPAILDYVATDYSSWDGEFSETTKRATRLGWVGEAIFGFKPRIKLDRVCSALDLPFKDGEFDYHLSFETLEHISDPAKYLSEAARVVKRGGHIALSVPFLYRVHGGEPDHKEDFFRYAPGFFYDQAEKQGLVVEKVFTNTGAGTSLSTLFNAWLIRRMFESWFLVRGVAVVFSPILFLVSNTLGWLIDLTPDKRFPTRYHVLLSKRS